MNLRQLETFVLVADSGSFSRAANELFLTQPTVSAHIQALEGELGVRLFVRNTREVKLSEEGIKLYQYAHRMLSLEREILEEFGVGEDNGEREIIIAASTIPSQYLLPDILFHFHEKYPEKQLKILEMDSAQVIKYISGYMADVGFAGTMLDQKTCRYIPLCKDELVVITPNQERFRRRLTEKEDISWILDERVIMREPGSGTRMEVAKMLKKTGIDFGKLNIAISMRNQETIKKSVRLGMGISILSKLAVEEEVKAGDLLAFSIPGAGLGRDIHLVYNKNIHVSKDVRCLINVVEEMYSVSPAVHDFQKADL